MTSMSALWTSILLGGVAQIALKRSVANPPGGAPVSGIAWVIQLLRSGWLWLYGLCFCAATALWLLALSGLDISYAFPLMSASYILVAILARFLLKESVSTRRWLAIGVICLGVIVIARS